MNLYCIKKILVLYTLFPVPLTILLLLTGIFLATAGTPTPKRKTAGIRCIFFSFGLFLLYVCAGWFPFAILENRYPCLHVTDDLVKNGPFVICVFSNIYNYDRSLPAPCRFPADFAERLQEACRIAQELEKRGADYTLAVSVQVQPEDIPLMPLEDRNNDLLAFADLFSIPHDNIVMIPDGCLNSKMEMIQFSQLHGRHILVSSANHVPRLMFLAPKCGIQNPIAAPAAKQAVADRKSFIPRAENLVYLRMAVYELYGMIQYLLP